MTERSNIMIEKKSKDNLDEEVPGYSEGVLLGAERKSVSSAELHVKDKTTGDEYLITAENMSSWLGSVRRYIDPDLYDSLSATEPAEIAEAILDTRDSGLRFYFYRPNARPA